ncbi:hypothetical protein HZP91_15310 [Elizabethkingia anophelis]|nr:hypothetical protein [Elizabethkingia anophelis]
MENKLIPMTDFVLKMELNSSSIMNELYKDADYNFGYVPSLESFTLGLLFGYTKFLKQQTQLGFFIPCENNIPLQEPIKYKEWLSLKEKNTEFYFNSENKDCEAYHKAKSRVLFEGFELLSDYNGMYRLRNAQNIDITFDSYGCYAEPFDSIPGKRINTIEEITYLDLTLTETAKQIYGS